MIIDAFEVCIKDLDIQVGDIFICHDTNLSDKWQELILSVTVNAKGDGRFDYPNVKIMYFCPGDGYRGNRRNSLNKKLTWLKYVIRVEKNS